MVFLGCLFLSEQCANKRMRAQSKPFNQNHAFYIDKATRTCRSIPADKESGGAKRNRSTCSKKALSLSPCTRRHLQTQVVPQLGAYFRPRGVSRGARGGPPPGTRTPPPGRASHPIHLADWPDWPHIILIQKLRAPSFSHTHTHIRT